ncbi:MAG: hypothetical protein IPP83_16395 [Flavobacteriales bacterium]|nr:hypothetical protein [Flavobacteriales bacterium]
MTSLALRKRIISLLNRRSDPYLLQEVHDLLAGEISADALQKRMEAGVLAGEADIVAGRTMGLAAFEKRIGASLRGKVAASSAKKRKT